MRFWTSYIFLSMICVSICQAAGTFAISGYVIDQQTKETIIGVNIIVRDEQLGAASDVNGFFRITDLTAGKHTLEFYHINYEVKALVVEIQSKSLVLDDVSLQPKPVELEEIVVTAPRAEIADVEIEAGHREISPDEIKIIPTARRDVLRAIKYLPGISGVGPVSPLYSVRGGDPGENLVLLDGVTVYNPYHFVTISGLFNLYAIKDVEIMVGGFSAEYGGRNSSILYVTTREGNSQKLHGEIEPSLTHTAAVFDFPVGHNATMLISGRYFYNLISRYLLYSPSYFYDMNISFNWRINRRNRLTINYFHTRDYFNYNSSEYLSYFSATFDTEVFDNYDLRYRINWKNQAATIILKSVISPRLYLKTQLSGSFFSSDNLSLLDFIYADEETKKTTKLFYRTNIDNKVREITAKSVLSFKWNSMNTLGTGLELSSFYFANNVILNYFGEGKSTRKPELYAGFVENKMKLGKFSFRGGLRVSRYNFVKNVYFEPRINAVIELPYNFRIKAAWGKYYQYIMSLNSQEYELVQFLDYYYPLESYEPAASVHYILGVEKTINENSQISLDFYYKDIQRTYTFDYNVSELGIYQFSQKLKTGYGKSYGLELLWKGNWKKFTGWVSYSFCKATRSYSHIMEGKEILFDYDRTHSFKAVISHQIHPRLSFSGSFQMMTGVPKTLETAGKSYFYYDPVSGNYATYGTYVTLNKNNARLPFYLRLDIGIKKQLRKGFAAELAEFIGARESYLNVTFGNLLFLLHRNVWFYFPVNKEKLYALGTNYIPEFNIGYTINF